jgi:ubiquinone/menaquinone biosynthesis C-methylase UbiE
MTTTARQPAAPRRDNELWQLEDSSAEAYERYAVPAWSRALAEALIDLAAPQPGERVLDVACGTGIVARLAAERVGGTGSVGGVDANDAMLAVAQAAATASTPPIEWRKGDAASLPLDDASFDLATCQQGLQFFGDRDAALAEIRRVLVPDGRLAVSVLLPLAYHPAWAALADALERHAGAEAGAMMRSPFPEGDAADLRELAATAGFRDVEVRIAVAPARYPSAEALVHQEVSYSPLAAAIAALDEATRSALVRDYASEIRPLIGDDGVTFAQQTYILLARR